LIFNYLSCIDKDNRLAFYRFLKSITVERDGASLFKLDPAPLLLKQNKIEYLRQPIYKPMLRAIIKCFGLLVAIELVLFIGWIATIMTDEKPPAIAGLFYWPLRYIFSFPLVFINHDYPFFVDTMIEFILLVTLNNLILAWAVAAIRNIYKRIPED
jgi:hypothetical protein